MAGTVGEVAFEDGVDGGKKWSIAGVEGVVGVGRNGAVEGHQVAGSESRAEDDVGDGEEAPLGVKVELAARVVLAVNGAVERPDGVVGFAGLGGCPDKDGLGEPVALQVGAKKVLGVEGEGHENRCGDDGADGALGCDGGGCDGGDLVLVAVVGDAKAGAFRRVAIAEIGIVGDPPQVMEDCFVVGDAGGGGWSCSRRRQRRPARWPWRSLSGDGRGKRGERRRRGRRGSGRGVRRGPLRPACAFGWGHARPRRGRHAKQGTGKSGGTQRAWCGTRGRNRCGRCDGRIRSCR